MFVLMGYKMSFSFTNVETIASVAHIFLLILLGNCSLKGKTLRILLGDLNTKVNFLVLWNDRHMSVNCSLLLRKLFLEILKIRLLHFSWMIALGDDIIKINFQETYEQICQ